MKTIADELAKSFKHSIFYSASSTKDRMKIYRPKTSVSHNYNWIILSCL